MALAWVRSVDQIDWEELSRLFKAAPLGDKKAADLKVAFSNSMYTCFALDAGRLVAAGRVLADGFDCAYVCDLAVHPSHQGTGVGRTLLADLIDRASGHKKIILYAVPGKEAFYKKFGFRRMTTAMALFKDQQAAFRSGLLLEP